MRFTKKQQNSEPKKESREFLYKVAKTFLSLDPTDRWDRDSWAIILSGPDPSEELELLTSMVGLGLGWRESQIYVVDNKAISGLKLAQEKYPEARTSQRDIEDVLDGFREDRKEIGWIWLDFTGPINESSIRIFGKAASLLSEYGLIAITWLGGRDKKFLRSHKDRRKHNIRGLKESAGAVLEHIYTHHYQSDKSSPMFWSIFCRAQAYEDESMYVVKSRKQKSKDGEQAAQHWIENPDKSQESVAAEHGVSYATIKRHIKKKRDQADPMAGVH